MCVSVRLSRHNGITPVGGDLREAVDLDLWTCQRPRNGNLSVHKLASLPLGKSLAAPYRPFPNHGS